MTDTAKVFNLFEFNLSSNIYLTNADRHVFYNANTYAPFPIAVSPVQKQHDAAPMSVNVSASGVDRSLISIILNERVQGKTAIIRRSSWTSPNSFTAPIVSFQGEIDAVYLEDKKTECDVAFELRNDFARWETPIPRSMYGMTCNWTFKSTTPGCQYTGASSICNRTYERCMELGNTDRFRGFRHIGKIDSAEVWWGRYPHQA